MSKIKMITGILTHYKKGETRDGTEKIVSTIDTESDGSINFHDFLPEHWNYEPLMNKEVKVYYKKMTHYNNLQAIIPSDKELPLEALT